MLELNIVSDFSENDFRIARLVAADLRIRLSTTKFSCFRQILSFADSIIVLQYHTGSIVCFLLTAVFQYHSDYDDAVQHLDKLFDKVPLQTLKFRVAEYIVLVQTKRPLVDVHSVPVLVHGNTAPSCKSGTFKFGAPNQVHRKAIPMEVILSIFPFF